MQSQRKQAIKRTRTLLYDLMITPIRSLRAKALRDRVSSCLKHYPHDYHLDELFKDEVCPYCNQDKEFGHHMGCGANKGANLRKTTDNGGNK